MVSVLLAGVLMSSVPDAKPDHVFHSDRRPHVGRKLRIVEHRAIGASDIRNEQAIVSDLDHAVLAADIGIGYLDIVFGLASEGIRALPKGELLTLPDQLAWGYFDLRRR